ncbi:MAG: AsmA family protein [Bacillota bacterium]
MKKALKITGIVVGILVLLIIALAVLLPFLINPNRFKDDIAQLVKERTGRELAVQGDIKLSVFPWLGLQIGPLELSNARGFGAVPFAAVNETDVHVAFWPLLRRHVEVGDIKIDGLSLDLERDADGHSNWQDLTERLSRGAKEGEGGSGGGVDLSGASVGVGDSEVRWTDAQKHQQYKISDFSLTLGQFASGKPFAVTSGFDFSGTNPALAGHVDFAGTADADLEHHIYSADAATLKLQAKGDGVPGGTADASLRWQHAAANLEQQSVAVNGFEAELYGLKLDVEAQGRDIEKSPNYTGTVKFARFSPRDVLKAVGRAAYADIRDNNALASATASFTFVATPTSLSINGLDMMLDSTHLIGGAGIKDYSSHAFSFDLTADQLDVDRYLPPQQLGTPDKPREEVDINKVGIPLRTVRSMNLDGHLHVGQFTFIGTKTTDLDMDLSAHDGLVQLKPMTASLYGGSLNAEMQVDARLANADDPVVDETLTLKGVQLAGLGQDLGKPSHYSGSLDVSSTGRAHGRFVLLLRRTLKGSLSFALKNGAIEGVNVTDSIARAWAAVRGQPVPSPTRLRTEFTELRGSGGVRDGVLNDRNFAALLPGLGLSGAGKLDLLSLTVDYALKGRVTGPGEGGVLAPLKGQSIPLHVTGTLSDLMVRPDTGAVKGKP